MRNCRNGRKSDGKERKPVCAPGKILLTGVTGFIGGRLMHTLPAAGVKPRCMIRSIKKYREHFPESPEVDLVEADLLDPKSIDRALRGIDLAYYLVHSMGGRSLLDNNKFVERDRKAAINFMNAAERSGLRRIIYLGGLGEVGDNLSEHLASRQEVARILQSGKVDTTILRAANIIGAGGAPFEMLRYMVERFPIIFAPAWIDTRCQPIDVYDALTYLIGCMEHEETAGREFDIGGPEIITYRKMMQIYARVRRLKRTIISAPVLTPRLSALFVSLVSPVPSGVVNPLLEGLKNEVICRENRIREIIPNNLIWLEDSICNALMEVETGPGKVLTRQACFLTGEH